VDFRFDAARPNDPPPLNSGCIFRTRIRNERHRVTVAFDERSAGFVWFFSFLVWFSQVRKTYGENVVLPTRVQLLTLGDQSPTGWLLQPDGVVLVQLAQTEL
jgi:hypothetical protein